MEGPAKECKYIYCIASMKEPKTFDSPGIGEMGNEVYTINYKDIAAIVSNSVIKDYPVSRENTLAHEKAIEEVMKEYVVLPVRFDTVADGKEKVEKILESEYDTFKDLLNKFEDKKELGIRAAFKEDIFKEILEKYNDIKKSKERIAGLPPERTYYQRAQIGEMVVDALQREKEIYKKHILDTLSPLAQEVKLNDTYGERMVINVAFLVEKAREEEFDQKVNELEEKFGEKIKFKYTGIVPPFNFVNLIIETGKY